MNKLNKIATAVALTLGIATTAYAHSDRMGDHKERGTHSGQHQGMHEGMEHGRMQGMKRDGENHAHRSETKGHGSHGEHGSKAAQSLTTPEERSAMHDKMRAAKTPEERQQIASANRAEMQKRATEKGITMPEHRGEHGRNRSNEEHKH
jgi:hypothetical protein